MESDFYLNPVGQQYKKITAFRFRSLDLFRLHMNLLNFFTAENHFTGEKKPQQNNYCRTGLSNRM